MRIHQLLRLTAASLVVSLCAQIMAAENDPRANGDDSLMDETLVYVGTYTGEQSKGIYLFKLQTENLEVSQNQTLVPLGLVAETANPTFLDIDPKRLLLFAVGEIGDFEGKPTGTVSAFSIDRATGKLKLLNQRPSMGAGPCHLILDRSGRHVLVAN